MFIDFSRSTSTLFFRPEFGDDVNNEDESKVGAIREKESADGTERLELWSIVYRRDNDDLRRCAAGTIEDGIE